MTGPKKPPVSLPLTERQLLVWIEAFLHVDVPVNHVTTLFEISGNIEPKIFSRAFDYVVRDHSALRAVLDINADEPKLIIRDDLPGLLDLIDLSEVADQEKAYQDWLQDRCRKLFGPDERLYDAALVKLAEGSFVFFLNQHHVITDSFSCVLLHKNLDALYLQLLAKENIDSSIGGEVVDGEFPEFIKQSGTYLCSNEATQNDAYWAQKFKDEPVPLRYYGRDTLEKKVLTRRVSRSLGPDISRKLRALAPEITLSVSFTTVLFSFLRRITSANDICIGVPLLNRAPEFKNTVGLLMEICPNQIWIDNDDSFDSILDKVREEVTAIEPYRNHTVSSTMAGYDAIMHYHTTSPASFAGASTSYELTTPLNLLNAIELDSAQNAQWASRMALSVHVHHCHAAGDFVVNFDFNLGLWPEGIERERAVEHFVLLLEAYLEDPRQKIDAVNILTPDERARMFPKEDCAASRGETLPTAFDLIAEQIAKRPDQTAIIFGEEELTYGELGLRVNRLAALLLARGVGTTSLVGVCLNRSPDMFIALLATMRAGAAYVPLDPKHPDSRIQYILEEADPVILLSEESLKHKLGEDRQDRVICMDTEYIPPGDSSDIDIDGEYGDLAYVIFTSGSTGRPKGVRVRHHGLSTFLRAMCKVPGFDEYERLLAITTISFDLAVPEIYLSFITGATLYLASYETAINANALADTLDKYAITVFQATPSTFRMLVASGWKGNAGLKILVGGEALSSDLAKSLLDRSASVWNMYGPTETTVWSTLKQIRSDQETISVGRPIPGTQVFILNDSLAPVPQGVAGELFIAGDGITNGYHGREDLTKESFLPNPFSRHKDALMYRTGDLVRYLPNLDLQYLGRVDFQVKIRGFRVELQEIEAVIEQLEAVHECVVTAIEDQSGEQALAAYVVIKRGSPPISRETIRDHLKSQLPAYMVPATIVKLEALPLTPNGKIDRKALPAPDDAELSLRSRVYVEPRNDLEISLTAAWQKILCVERVGITDNFFDLGGHSILALTLVAEMERATGLGFDLGEIFETPTISSLLAERSSSLPRQAAIVVPLQEKGEETPVFCLCGINLYQELADNLSEDQPVLAVYVAEEQALLERAGSGPSADLPVQRLAKLYCSAIRRYQPNGPYRLIGISFGGALAMEVASLLQSEGEPVEVVMMLDTVLDSAISKNWPKWIKAQFQAASRESAAKLFSKLVHRIRTKLGAVWERGQAISTNVGGNVGEIAHGREVLFKKATKNYSPAGQIFQGKIVLFRAADRTAWGAGTEIAADYGWGNYLDQGLDIVDIPGDHLGIIKSPHVRDIAEKIRRYISKPIDAVTRS